MTEEKAPKKVMVGIPTTDYVHVNFATSLASMVLNSKIPLTVRIARGSSICANRNTLVHEARKAGSDFLLFIDNDMSFPWFVPDRLVYIAEEQGLDIIGCNYLFKSPPHQWMVKPRKESTHFQAIDEVERLPTGMMLVRMSVFDKLDIPYFNYDTYSEPDTGLTTVASEDYYFCDRAREKGIKIFIDTDLSFGLVHWGSPIGVRWINEDPGYQYLHEPLVYSTQPQPQPQPPGQSVAAQYEDVLLET